MKQIKASLAQMLVLHSIPQAAEILGMKPAGLWGMVQRRDIASVKIGRLRKISSQTLEKYIERNTIPAMKDWQ